MAAPCYDTGPVHRRASARFEVRPKEREMKPIRVLSAVVLSLAVALAGCNKDKKEDGKGGAAAGGAGKAGVQQILTMFPADSNLVVGINLAGLRGTKLWTQMWPTIEQQGGEELAEFKATCNIDVGTAVNTITVGGNVDKKDNMLIAVTTTVPRDQVLKCVPAMAQKKGKTVEVKEDGKFVSIKEGETTKSFAWADGSTVVFSAGDADDRPYLEERLAGKDSVTGNQEFMKLVNATDSTATLWIAFVPPEGGSNPMMGGGAQPKAVYASIKLGEGMKMNAGMRYATPEEATKTAEEANKMMEPAKGDATFGKYVNKTKIAAAGNEVTINVDLNQQEFDELVALIQQQLPMLMMMLGGAGGM
jgi:hypothetical protein